MFSSLCVKSGAFSPNHSGKRTEPVSRLSPHCVVGQAAASRFEEMFASPSRQASSNYGISYDGKIVGIVDEDFRSWCTSSEYNDQRAITVEIASENVDPYRMNDAAIEAFIDLAVDICRRYKKDRVVWIPDKDTALAYKTPSNELLITVHRWYANKSCPGDYMFDRLTEIAGRINTRLAGIAEPKEPEIVGKCPYLWGTPIVDAPPILPKVLRQCPKGTYTIIEEKDGYGRLKSGAGWVLLAGGKEV